MELLHEAEEATKSRKLIKSQVEKRRRERMNRSLERLRTMLLQEPHEVRKHRVEKAEILEHTILFLQNTATGEKATGGGGSRKSSFQDGFSTCLQTASRFLGPEGKRSQLGSALDAAFAARLARSHSHPQDTAEEHTCVVQGSSLNAGSTRMETPSNEAEENREILDHERSHAGSEGAGPSTVQTEVDAILRDAVTVGYEPISGIRELTTILFPMNREQIIHSITVARETAPTSGVLIALSCFLTTLCRVGIKKICKCISYTFQKGFMHRPNKHFSYSVETKTCTCFFH
uniref:BHLH domain-containing protein n=1 Tax=Amphilophus citrinellus TaxID=61819 RepID=A0A3Q0QUW3_AMPCI